jgi:glycine cleavage system protein P-like pyridoxal-binding family
MTKSMGKKAASYMQTYPRWHDVSEAVISEIIKVFDTKRSEVAV